MLKSTATVPAGPSTLSRFGTSRLFPTPLALSGVLALPVESHPSSLPWTAWPPLPSHLGQGLQLSQWGAREWSRSITCASVSGLASVAASHGKSASENEAQYI
jgi:hypothetical protein